MAKKPKPDLCKLQALHACHILKAAYDDGKRNGGSIEWSDVDMAYSEALKALRMEKRS